MLNNLIFSFMILAVSVLSVDSVQGQTLSREPVNQKPSLILTPGSSSNTNNHQSDCVAIQHPNNNGCPPPLNGDGSNNSTNQNVEQRPSDGQYPSGYGQSYGQGG